MQHHYHAFKFVLQQFTCGRSDIYVLVRVYLYVPMLQNEVSSADWSTFPSTGDK